MALSLAVPAFAIEDDVPVGSYTVDLDKPDTEEMGVYGEFTVRYLTSSRSYEEPQPRPSEPVPSPRAPGSLGRGCAPPSTPISASSPT